MKMNIKIGTRASLLALAQSNWIKSRIESEYPETTVELVKIITKGDKILDVPLAKVGGKGLFVKEIEEALLKNEIDLAVHSMKDVPSELPDELHIGIVTEREDPRDAFIGGNYRTLADLPVGARVGTSSLRRKAQLMSLRSDLQIEDLRGNLDTRLRKLDEGMYDAIILAAAGLNRLNLTHRATAYFSPEEMLPAVAQGAVGIELRKNDNDLLKFLSFLAHAKTTCAVTAERAFLHRLEGGCQVPIGGYGVLEGDNIRLTGIIASIDGKQIIKESLSGKCTQGAELGRQLADELLGRGGKAILDEVYEN